MLYEIHKCKRSLCGRRHEHRGSWYARHNIGPETREEFMDRFALGCNLATNRPSPLIPCEHHHGAEGSNQQGIPAAVEYFQEVRCQEYQIHCQEKSDHGPN